MCLFGFYGLSNFLGYLKLNKCVCLGLMEYQILLVI